MASGYKTEQKSLSKTMEANEKRLAELQNFTVDLRMPLKTLRECTDITELNRTLVNKLIQHIEIHNNDKYDVHCHVKMDIYFTGAGIIDIPTEQEIIGVTEEIHQEKNKRKII